MEAIVLDKKSDESVKTAAKVAWEWVYMSNLTLAVHEDPKAKNQIPHLFRRIVVC